MARNRNGFTIVELLIVIVVIAILAAISVVAFTGIQQRANNAKTISAVSQVVKTISGYIAANGAYPSTGTYCITPAESSCVAYSTRAMDTTLTNNLKTIGALPSVVPDARPEYNGIVYEYSPDREVGGIPRPLAIFYSLRGEGHQCTISTVLNTGGVAADPSTTGWTVSSNGYTVCVVSIAGP